MSPARETGSGRSADAPPRLEGQLVDERYRVGKHLASGAFGHVYEARQQILGRTLRRVAFKLLKQPNLERGKLEEHFRDVLAVAALAEAHPGHAYLRHVVGVHDAGLCDVPRAGGGRDRHGYVVMEFVPRDLQREMRQFQGRSLPLALALSYARDVCRGLYLAHRMTPPVVHRDVKPPNVLITQDGDAKVSDFGLAQAVLLVVGRTSGAGDLFCQAPEVLEDEAYPASDVYSVGLTLYEMVTGRHAFQDLFPLFESGAARLGAGERTEIHRKRRDQPITPAAELNPLLRRRPDACDVLERCLRRRPSERYADAARLLEALEALEREGTEVAPPPKPESGARALDLTRLLQQSLEAERQGHLDVALEFAARVAAVADARRDRVHLGQAVLRAGRLKGELGRWDEAETDLFRAQREFGLADAAALRVRLAQRRAAGAARGCGVAPGGEGARIRELAASLWVFIDAVHGGADPQATLERAATQARALLMAARSRDGARAGRPMLHGPGLEDRTGSLERDLVRELLARYCAHIRKVRGGPAGQAARELEKVEVLGVPFCEALCRRFATPEDPALLGVREELRRARAGVREGRASDEETRNRT